MSSRCRSIRCGCLLMFPICQRQYRRLGRPSIERMYREEIRTSWLMMLLCIIVVAYSPSIGKSDENRRSKAALRPNIVIILADDLGYGDVNFELPGIEEFANPHIRTPHLAALAQQSVVFRHHYAAAPVCSPSRAGLMTGRTPTRCNIDLYISDLRDNEKRFLAGPEITIAEIARSAGYSTAVFGKWHLNGADWERRNSWNGWTGSFPAQQGFQHGWVSKENPHFTRELQVNTQKHPGDFFWLDGKALGTMKGYSSDLITAAAIGWMEEATEAGQPFLLYLPYDAVHIRISSPDEFESAYSTGDTNRDIYYANVSHLDSAIGRLLEGMDQLGLGENTLVVFSSDNGPDVHNKWHGTSMCLGTSYPLYGHKYQLHEGGIRVPGMIRWPAELQPRVSDEPNSTVDLLPTICELVGVPVPSNREIDGSSLLSHLLTGADVNRTKPLYWQFEHPLEYESIEKGYYRRHNGRRRVEKPTANVSIRYGDYVLRGIQQDKYAAPESFQLFNVVNDVEARNDVAKQHPDLLRRMRKELLQMHSSIAADRMKTLGFIESRGKNGLTFD